METPAHKHVSAEMLTMWASVASCMARTALAWNLMPSFEGDLTDTALEGQLAQKQLRALLVAADVAEGDGAGEVIERLFHAAAGWSRCPPTSWPSSDRTTWPCSAGNLFCRLGCSVLGTCHFALNICEEKW